MKNCFFVLITILISAAQDANAKEIILDIPENDIRAVEHDVVDAEEWIRNAWAGKVAKCRQRIVRKAIEGKLEKKQAFPAGEDQLVEEFLNSPEFTTRKERDALDAPIESTPAILPDPAKSKSK